MHTLIIDNVPDSLFDRIKHLAEERQQSPAAMVVEVLQAALPETVTTFSQARLPQEPFLTEDIVAPCNIPRPTGQRIIPVDIGDYVPKPHDWPTGE